MSRPRKEFGWVGLRLISFEHIDDCRFARINQATSTEDTVKYQHVDEVVALARCMHQNVKFGVSAPVQLLATSTSFGYGSTRAQRGCNYLFRGAIDSLSAPRQKLLSEQNLVLNM